MAVISDVCIHLSWTVYIQAAWKTGQEGRKGLWKGAGQSKKGEIFMLRFAYTLIGNDMQEMGNYPIYQ